MTLFLPGKSFRFYPHYLREFQSIHCFSLFFYANKTKLEIKILVKIAKFLKENRL
jgi:hypothetical protein